MHCFELRFTKGPGTQTVAGTGMFVRFKQTHLQIFRDAVRHLGSTWLRAEKPQDYDRLRPSARLDVRQGWCPNPLSLHLSSLTSHYTTSHHLHTHRLKRQRSLLVLALALNRAAMV